MDQTKPAITIDPPLRKASEGQAVITLQDFEKLDLRIAKVKAAEQVAGTDKLLKITLDLGSQGDQGGLGERIIASSIKPWYSPEELVGKNILYLANLEPRTFKGVTSQGMLVAAEDEKPARNASQSSACVAGGGDCVLLITDKEIAPGTKVH